MAQIEVQRVDFRSYTLQVRLVLKTVRDEALNYKPVLDKLTSALEEMQQALAEADATPVLQSTSSSATRTTGRPAKVQAQFGSHALKRKVTSTSSTAQR